jgi:SAM-dependent methyltransferase
VSPSGPVDWLDPDRPLDPGRDRAQVDGLLARLGPSPRRVVDLGCGAGRTLVPLAVAGHEVTGLDRRPDALERCAAALRAAGRAARLLEADFTEPWPIAAGTADLVCCLGNTFMTVHDVDVAVEVLARAATALLPGGAVALDDLAGEFWPELGEGRWTSGLAPDGSAQLVWADDDAVFTLRTGADVDEEAWSLRPGDRRFRLWTTGSLRLAARAAGLSAPRRVPETCLLVMERP